MVWVVVVEVGMTAMEGNHESFVWQVVWVAVVEAGMAAIDSQRKHQNVTNGRITL